MNISLIAAQDQNRTIGYQGKIPWHLPDDLRHFKELTLNHHLIMGRKTFESLGKPLPSRTSIVLTHNTGYKAEGCIVTRSPAQALQIASQANQSEVFVIGGQQIYEVFFPLASKIYLTQIYPNPSYLNPKGDAFFPEFDRNIWTETSRVFHASNQTHKFAFAFLTFEKLPTDS